MKRFKYFTITTWLICLACFSILFLNFQRKNGSGNIKIKKDDKGFAVVELFTSEGCSSCPPADALVATLQQENQDKPIYVLAVMDSRGSQRALAGDPIVSQGHGMY